MGLLIVRIAWHCSGQSRNLGHVAKDTAAEGDRYSSVLFTHIIVSLEAEQRSRVRSRFPKRRPFVDLQYFCWRNPAIGLIAPEILSFD